MNLEIIKSLNKQKAKNALEIILSNLTILKVQIKTTIKIDLQQIEEQTIIYKNNLNNNDLSLLEIDDILSYIDKTHTKLREAL